MLLGSTRFAVTGGRGVQYSYDVNQPYYVQSRIGGSVAQQIFGPFDVQVRGDDRRTWRTATASARSWPCPIAPIA